MQFVVLNEFEILPMECNLSNVLEKECNRMDNVLNKRDSYAPGFLEFRHILD